MTLNFTIVLILGHDIFVEHDESLNELVAAEKELESASTSRDLLPVFVMPDAKRNAKKVSHLPGSFSCHLPRNLSNDGKNRP